MSSPSPSAEISVEKYASGLPIALLFWKSDGSLLQVVGELTIDDANVRNAFGDITKHVVTHGSFDELVELATDPNSAVRIQAQRSNIDGDIIVGVVTDGSELKRLREIRSEFVADVSHELKTPVGAISLLAEQLVAGNDEATTQRFTQRIYEESIRLSKLIEDLTDLSQLEAKAIAASLQPVDIQEVIRDAVEGRRAMAENAEIEIVVRHESSELKVVGDRRLLVSALKNLLENAIKYSDTGERVTVSTDVVDGYVSISVRDKGIGIPEEHVELIFHRFHRVDRARARDTGGFGLGLSTVRHIARTHGGHVAVQSIEGEGSTFTIYLPINVVLPK